MCFRSQANGHSTRLHENGLPAELIILTGTNFARADMICNQMQRSYDCMMPSYQHFTNFCQEVRGGVRGDEGAVCQVTLAVCDRFAGRAAAPEEERSVIITSLAGLIEPRDMRCVRLTWRVFSKAANLRMNCCDPHKCASVTPLVRHIGQIFHICE